MHRFSPAEVLLALQTDTNGLSEGRVSELRAQYGPNVLEGKPPRPGWMILLFQFKDVMILILMFRPAGIMGNSELTGRMLRSDKPGTPGSNDASQTTGDQR